MARVVFMGTPEFAVPALKAINARFRIVLVVTQPDRPRGRGQKTAPTAVKEAALAMGLPVLQPKSLRGEEFMDKLISSRPDFLVAAAFGRILPGHVLRVPTVAAVNIHASLLPRYRGAAPIHRAVLNGDKETGITIMHMDEGMDTGDIICRQSIPIGPDDTTGKIHDVLKELGAGLVVAALQALLEGSAPRIKQDHNLATPAPPLAAGEEEIDWAAPADAVHNLVRGMNPWPGAYTYFRGNRLKIWLGRPADTLGYQPGPAGTVIAAGADGIRVATGRGDYLITELQPPGRRAMTAAEYLCGNTVVPGEVLGGRCAHGSA